MVTALLARTGERQAQAVLEFAAIDETRERVMARLVRQLRRIFTLAPHIMEHQHHAHDGARTVANRRGGFIDRNLGAVAPQQQYIRRNLDAGSRAQDDLDRIGQSLARRLVEGLAHDMQGLPAGLERAPTRQRLGHRIEIVDQAVDVRGDHRVADRLERHLRALLFREQLRFGELAVGDVGHRTGHAHRPAPRVAHRTTASAKPAQITAFGQATEFQVVCASSRK